jgi:hypothetical protein
MSQKLYHRGTLDTDQNLSLSQSLRHIIVAEHFLKMDSPGHTDFLVERLKDSLKRTMRKTLVRTAMIRKTKISTGFTPMKWCLWNFRMSKTNNPHVHHSPPLGRRWIGIAGTAKPVKMCHLAIVSRNNPRQVYGTRINSYHHKINVIQVAFIRHILHNLPAQASTLTLFHGNNLTSS